jgi:hypothetical protein
MPTIYADGVRECFVMKWTQVSGLPRKVSKVKDIEPVPQTDTGRQVEYTKANE